MGQGQEWSNCDFLRGTTSQTQIVHLDEASPSLSRTFHEPQGIPRPWIELSCWSLPKLHSDAQPTSILLVDYLLLRHSHCPQRNLLLMKRVTSNYSRYETNSLATPWHFSLASSLADLGIEGTCCVHFDYPLVFPLYCRASTCFLLPLCLIYQSAKEGKKESRSWRPLNHG